MLNTGSPGLECLRGLRCSPTRLRDSAVRLPRRSYRLTLRNIATLLILLITLSVLVLDVLYIEFSGIAVVQALFLTDPQAARDVTLPACPDLAGAEQIVVTVKTGATEASRKVPILLGTSLRCTPHALIFSDLKDGIAGRTVHDALEDVDERIKNSPDFDLYHQQYVLGNPARIAEEHSDRSKTAAWNLDKYKNGHIVEKTWQLHPDADWYVHIDADSYIVWPTLVAWLNQLDPAEEWYIGSPAFISGTTFAHGGSGYVLSHAATRNFAAVRNGTAARMDAQMQNECCGDHIIGRQLYEYGIGLSEALPTVQGHVPQTMDFKAEDWCKPLATLHHVGCKDAEAFAAFEQAREDVSIPLTYGELFRDFVWAQIPDTLSAWDNSYEYFDIHNSTSIEECREACLDRPGCLQGTYNGSQCRLVWDGTACLGRADGTDSGWTSFWNRARMERKLLSLDKYSDIAFPFVSV